MFALQLITSFIRVLDQNFNMVFKAGLGYVRPCRKKMGGKGAWVGEEKEEETVYKERSQKGKEVGWRDL